MSNKRFLTLLVILTLAHAFACSPTTLYRNSSPTVKSVAPKESTVTTATVIEVIDGATIRVDTGSQIMTVRYLGIEIPEPQKYGKNEETLWTRAKLFNQHLVQNTIVELEKGTPNSDLFGRLLRFVYVNGEMVNITMLANGLAVVANYPQDFGQRTAFLIVEERAKRDQRGLWNHPNNSVVKAATKESSKFGGGTLPAPPEFQISNIICDYSGTDQALIKGNVDSTTGSHTYHVPDGFFYETTIVDQSKGDKWLCTELEAINAGWKKSNH